MATEVKKLEILNPEFFYKYLITNEGFSNDFSLYALNTYLDEKGEIKKYFDLDVSNLAGEWLEGQTNTYDTLTDDQELTIGNFQYLNTVINEMVLFPQYTEIFKLEVLGFEKDREKYIKFFDDFANKVNNTFDVVEIDGKQCDLVISLGDYSLPVYSTRFDLGGTERFMISMSFLITVTSELVNSNKIKLSFKTSDGSYESIPYNDFKLGRSTGLSPDNRASKEQKYYYEKSNFAFNFTGLYFLSEFCKTLMRYAYDPNKLETVTQTIKLEDEALGVTQEYLVNISSIEVAYSFGAPVAYSVSFQPSV